MIELIKFLTLISMVLGATLIVRWSYRGKNTLDEYGRTLTASMALIFLTVLVFILR